MRNQTAIRILFALLAASVLSAQGSQAQLQRFSLQNREYRFENGKWYRFLGEQKGDEIIPLRLLVRLKNRGTMEAFDFQRLNINGVSFGSRRFLDGFYVLSIAPTQNPFTIASSLETSSLFDVLEFDAYGKRGGTPNDPLYSSQWNLPKLQMSTAWNITTGNSSVILAIIDSGIQYSHEDLDGNIWVDPAEDRNGNGRPDFTSYFTQGGDLDFTDNDGNGYVDDLIGWDFAGGNNDPQSPFSPDNNPDDTDKHGTAVAGISSAQTNNSENGSYLGVAGIAGGWGSQKGASLMVLRDGGEAAIASLTIQAIEYAAENGARVINISSGFWPEPSGMADAVNAAVNNYDVFFVASAGNNGNHPDPSIRYPAKFSNVIAVGATDQNDNRRFDSAYGPELNVMAPGSDIRTTDLMETAGYEDGNYYSGFGQTSGAAPHAAGIAALIRSINSSFSWQQVRDVIQTTAEKVPGMGGQEFTNLYGHGRANALKALAYILASSNQSVNQTATGQNNGRHLVKDNSNAYHLVFASAGEIFYRRTLNGSTWQAPIRISNGQGSNDFPCLTLHINGALYAVWQRKTGTNSYQIWFAMSLDNGVTWSANDRYVLATASLSNDPLPAIQADYDGLAKQVVYRTGSGLTSYVTTWQYPYSLNWAQKSLNGTTSVDFWPSLADQANGSSSTPCLAYATTSGAIYYRYYTGNWSSVTNLSSIIPGSNYTHKEPSLCALPNGSSVHLAWHRVYGSGSSNYDHSIIYRKSTNYSTWPSEYTAIYYEQQQLPTITALASNKIDVIFQLTGSAQIYKQHFNGSSWSSPVFIAAGRYPSASAGQTMAKYVWTSGASSPYTIQLSSETLSKETGSERPEYSRSISWLDGFGAYLEVRLNNIHVKTKNGVEQPLEFVRASLDSFQLTTANAWDLLASTSSLLPAEAESLIVEYTVGAENLEKVVEPGTGPRQIKLNLVDSDQRTVATVSGVPLAIAGNIDQSRYRITAALNGVSISTALTANLRVEGLHAKNEVIASLGHIYDFNQSSSSNLPRPADSETDLLPKNFALFENYPNPFNPETIIMYQIPNRTEVRLAIYGLLGQEIRVLANQAHEVGVHQVRWDGRNASGEVVPSGVYLYRMQAENFSQTKKMTLLR